jgi:hypothetical protein
MTKEEIIKKQIDQILIKGGCDYCRFKDGKWLPCSNCKTKLELYEIELRLIKEARADIIKIIIEELPNCTCFKNKLETAKCVRCRLLERI